MRSVTSLLYIQGVSISLPTFKTYHVVRVCNITKWEAFLSLHFISLPQKVDGLYPLNENLKVFVSTFLYDL